MLMLSRITDYIIKIIFKLGFFKTGVIFFLSLTLILFYLRHGTSPELKSSQRNFRMKDVTEYCNSPHEVYGKESDSLEGFTLTQVHIFIRHGDRAPVKGNAIPHINPVRMSCTFNDSNVKLHRDKLEQYRKIINKNLIHVKGSNNTKLLDEKPYCYNGQLTPYGYLQHLYNGLHFRHSYHHFLSHVDLNTEVLIQSTDVRRTIQSSALLFVGMFMDEMLSADDLEVFINVYRDENTAHMLLDENRNILSCPRLHDLKGFRLTQQYKEFKTKVVNLEQTLADILLLKKESLPTFNLIVDILYTMLCHDQGVPLGPRSAIPQSLVKQFLLFSHVYGQVIHINVTEHQTLSLLSQVAMHSLASLTNEDEYKKIVIYSGHDTMITPLLMILSPNKDVKWPPYASKLVVEIFQDNNFHEKMSLKERINNTYFRIFYNGVLMKKVKFCYTSNKKTGLCSLNALFHYVSDGLYNVQLVELDSVDPPKLNQVLFARIRKLCNV